MLTLRERCIRSILLENPNRIPLILNIRPEPYEKLRKTREFNCILKIHMRDISTVKISASKIMGVVTNSL
jgi:hypothetical protein